jgi:transcriptional regulator with GAF, ATPase, and Fis domain
MIEKTLQTMKPRLLAISGPADGSSYSLTQPEITIGREPSNQISIADPLLSRRHCRLVISGENDSRQFQLIDEGGLNGTLVNGVPIQSRGEHKLIHGEVIRIGNSSLLFLCQIHEDLPTGEHLVEFDNAPLDQRPTVAIERRESRHLSEQQITASFNAPTQEPDPASKLIHEFHKILQFMLELSSLREPVALHRRLFELIGEIVPAERGAILLAAPAGGEPTIAYSWRRSSSEDGRFIVSQTLLNRILGEGRSFLENDPLATPELKESQSLIASGIHSLLAMPLAVGAHVYGALYLDARNPAIRFNEDHLHLMTTIAEVAGPAYDSARQLAQFRDETARLRDALNLDREMIGQSQPMLEVRDFIAHVAPTDFTVLIQGESGTGKELVARALHQNSPRRDKPFLAINCAVGPEALFESELFGHEKGAFTGATAMKKGKLEQAGGGTVFLDEIGELAPELQAKLLRVLQEREFERVGGARLIKLDARIITATNKDLETAIKTNAFRDDLFYRINAFKVTIPPLRNRPSDIPHIAEYLVAKYAPQCGRRVRGISPEACQTLMGYSWRGNVRELEHAIEHAIVYCNTDIIEPDDLPDHIVEAQPFSAAEPPVAQPESQPQSPWPLPPMKYHDAVRESKRRIIARTLEETGGDFHLAAQILSIHVNNLHRFLRDLGLRPPRTKK